MLLAIDTSIGCAVAVVQQNGVIRAEYALNDSRHHAEAVGIGIEQCLADAGIIARDITRVVSGMGPGPFTGLRVGVAAARSFAFARGIDCTPIPSHDAIAHVWRAANPDAEHPIAVVTDARRRQVAVSTYAPGRIAAVERPALADPSELILPEGHVRVEADRVSAAHLALAALAREAAGEAQAADELLYLRAPDAVRLSDRAARKRVRQ